MSPDLTLCDNDQCPRSLGCYRFCAVPDPRWQSWAHFEPQNGECPAFLVNRPGDRLRDLGNEKRLDK